MPRTRDVVYGGRSGGSSPPLGTNQNLKTMKFEIRKDARRLKFQTRGGLEVRDWFFVNRPHTTFFPIRAIIVLPNGTTEEHPYTRSGRRYINVESELDLIPIRVKRERAEGLDCMPDLLRAIECVKNKDMSGVRSANKDNDVWTGAQHPYCPEVEIGSSYDRMD